MIMKEGSFVHLHVRSNYSRDGFSFIDDLLIQAESIGQKSLALTDFNTIAGAISFYKKAEEHKIKPIIGCELSFLPFKSNDYAKKTYSLLLLVENFEGYQNLVNLINHAQTNIKDGEVYLKYSDMEKQVTGLICLFGGLRGEFTELLKNKKVDLIEEYINTLINIFGIDNICSELLPPYYDGHEKINKFTDEISKMLNIKVAASNDVHCALKEDALPALFLLKKNINGEQTVEGLLEENKKSLYLTSESEMKELFKDFPHALENTSVIAERCSLKFNFDKKPFPKHDFIRGVDADSFLWNHLREKIEEKYNTSSNPSINERFNTELEYLKQRNLSNYFVLLLKIAEYLKQEGVSTGIGRGNLLTSLVSYLAGITSIDPIDRQPMNFQEFSDNDKYPSLSLEIPSNHIDGVIEFIKTIYPEKFMCFVGNYRSPDKEQLLKMIFAKLNISENMQTIYNRDEILETKIGKNDNIKTFIGNSAYNLKIKNPNIISFVFGKLLVSQKKLEYTQNQIALTSENMMFLIPSEQMDKHNPYSLSQYNYESLVDLGLAIISFQTEKNLDIINVTLKLIREEYGEDLDINRISFTDKETFENLSLGETTGIPFFESITFKTLLIRQKPKNLEQLRKVVVELRKSSPSKINKFSENEFLRSVVETDFGYKCAYLKTHYPAAYITALITTLYESRDYYVYIREAKKIGLSVKQIDILTSDYDFKQDNKEIRMGLCAIPSFERNSFKEMEKIKKTFPYNDLYDLISITDTKILPLNLIKKLIQCGAFDSVLSLSRAQMLKEFNLISSRMSDDVSGTAGGTVSSAEEITKADVPEEDNLSDILNMELSVVKFPISIDQIEINKKFLEKIYAIPAIRINHKLKDDIHTFVGYIDSFDREGPFINDKISIILDFEGILVKVPEKIAKKYEYAIQTNLPVVILGKVVVANDELEIEAISINTIAILEFHAKNASPVVLNLDKENENTLKEIYKEIKKFKGETPIIPQNFPNEKKRILRKIKESKVLVCPLLMYRLKNILSPENVGQR